MAYGPYSSGYQFDPRQTSSGNADGSFWNSPAAGALISAGGGALSAYGQSQSDSANRQQNSLQFAAQMRQNQYNADRSLSAQRAGGVLSADPLGADQQFAQKNALMAAILPNLRNFHSAPGDPGVAAAMGGGRGGVMNALGPNGLDPAMVQSLYGQAATMASIVKRNQELTNLDPNAPAANLTAMYGKAAAPYQAQISDWAQKAQNMDAQQKAQFEAQITDYVNQMVQQEQQDGGGLGFWHKFAQIAGYVGMGAAIAFTGGAATPLAMAGAGALSGWGSGGGLKGTLLGAGMGALGGVGAGAASAATRAATQGVSGFLKTTATNPALISAIVRR